MRPKIKDQIKEWSIKTFEDLHLRFRDIWNIFDGHIENENIAKNTIKADKIFPNTITSDKLASAVTAKLVTNGDSHDHAYGDGAQIPEAGITLQDTVLLNVSATKHGLCPKATNDIAYFLRADGAWALPNGYQLIGQQVFTSGSGTYTKTAGVRAIVVEAVGGGAGGGGAAYGTGPDKWGVGGGGGAGGYSRKLITSVAASYDYSVGAAASGGTAGANPGSAGNATTFGNPAIITCNGGAAGVAGTAYANPGAGLVASFVLPQPGGTASGGDINISGGSSYFGVNAVGTVNGIVSGAGGDSCFGIGGNRISSPGVGNNGTGYGSGGGGAYANPSTNRAGGNGAAGIIIVWEFI